MWWTTQADGLRVWFPVTAGNGTLRTGLVAGDFTATVIAPADGANNIPTVAESSQLSGMYFFDVPTSFLTTNGTGDYGVSIEIAATSPTLNDAIGGTVRVSIRDLDDLATIEGGYLGAIWIDAVNGNAGTTIGTNGTKDNPVTTIADATTLAGTTGLRQINLIDTPVTLAGTYNDFKFIGTGEGCIITLANQDTSGAQFENVRLTGDMNGTAVAFDCVILNVTDLTGRFTRCHFSETNTIDPVRPAIEMFDCNSRRNSGTGATYVSIIDLGAAHATAMVIRVNGWSGSIEIRNMDNATDRVEMHVSEGLVTLGATVSNGTFELSGLGKLNDSSIGATTFDRAGFLEGTAAVVDAVWDELEADHQAAGSFGQFMRVIAGLGSHLNTLLDGGPNATIAADVDTNGTGFVTRARARVFDTAANKNAATPGNSGLETGEIFRAEYVGTPIATGSHRIKNYEGEEL